LVAYVRTVKTASGALPRPRANRIWVEIAMLAADLIAHLERLTLDGTLGLAEPKPLRLSIFSVAGRLARSARRCVLRIHRVVAAPAGWRPDLYTFAPADVIRQALILATSTDAGTVERDAPAWGARTSPTTRPSPPQRTPKSPQGLSTLSEALVYMGRLLSTTDIVVSAEVSREYPGSH